MRCWRLRLLDAQPPLQTSRSAIERGHAVLAVLVLSPIDVAMLGAALLAPVWLLTEPLRGSGAGLGRRPEPAVRGGSADAARRRVPITAWAGARAALARALLTHRDPDADRRLVEVTRSRARPVDALESERRRIERCLHDGTQQRLTALTAALGLARLDLATGSAAAVQVSTAHEHAKQALAELREIVRGVHPQILTDRGLPAVVADAASRSPTPIHVDIVLPAARPSQSRSPPTSPYARR